MIMVVEAGWYWRYANGVVGEYSGVAPTREAADRLEVNSIFVGGISLWIPARPNYFSFDQALWSNRWIIPRQ